MHDGTLSLQCSTTQLKTGINTAINRAILPKLTNVEVAPLYWCNFTGSGVDVDLISLGFLPAWRLGDLATSPSVNENAVVANIFNHMSDNNILSDCKEEELGNI